jgi:hypothetical protein
LLTFTRKSRTKNSSGSAFAYFGPDLHPKKFIENESHFEVLKGPTYDFEFILPDGLENGFNILLRVNQGIS